MNPITQQTSQYSVVFKKYWCHACRKEQTKRLEDKQIEQEQFCSQCETALEQIIPQQAHPKEFEIYQQQRRARFVYRPLFYQIFIFNDDHHQQQEGASEQQIQALRREEHNGECEKTCYICQEDFEKGDKICMMNCHHGYHEQCISTWLRMNNSCPVCRAKQN